MRGRGGCSARNGLSADTTPTLCDTTHEARRSRGRPPESATCRRDMLGTCTYDGKGGRIDRGGGWIDASRRCRVRATERGRRVFDDGRGRLGSRYALGGCRRRAVARTPVGVEESDSGIDPAARPRRAVWRHSPRARHDPSRRGVLFCALPRSESNGRGRAPGGIRGGARRGELPGGIGLDEPGHQQPPVPTHSSLVRERPTGACAVRQPDTRAAGVGHPGTSGVRRARARRPRRLQLPTRLV